MSILIGGIDEHGVYLAADKRAVNIKTRATTSEDVMKIHQVNGHVAFGMVGNHGLTEYALELLRRYSSRIGKSATEQATFYDIQSVLTDIFAGIINQYSDAIEQSPVSILLAGDNTHHGVTLARWDSINPSEWRNIPGEAGLRAVAIGPSDLSIEECNNIVRNCVNIARQMQWPLLSAFTTAIGIISVKSASVNDKFTTWSYIAN